MRVLFLSQRVPYPPNRGDKITTWRLIERMKRSHEVRVVAFAHDDEDRQEAEVLEASEQASQHAIGSWRHAPGARLRRQ